MPAFLTRAPLTALLVGLFLIGCQDEGLTGPDTATPATPTFASVMADEAEVVTAETMKSGTEFAARSGETSNAIDGPTVITEPGVYTVSQDFSTDGDGIVIQADDVYLDLAGFTITGPGHKEGRGIVVENADRVVVGGGYLDTFGIGVQLVGATRTAVVGVRVQGGDEFADPPNGIAPQIGFLLVNSAHNRLQGSYALQTNLGIFVRGGESMRNRIRGNVAEAGENGLLAICYNPAPDTDDPTGPSLDLVGNNTLVGFGTGISASAGSANNAFARNTIYYLAADYQDLNGSNVFEDNETMQIGS